MIGVICLQQLLRRFLFVVPLYTVLSGAHAAPEFEFRFLNGATLIGRVDKGLFYKPSQWQAEQEIVKGKVLTFPKLPSSTDANPIEVRGVEGDWTTRLFSYTPFNRNSGIIYVDEKPFVVFENGQFIHLNTLKEKNANVVHFKLNGGANAGPLLRIVPFIPHNHDEYKSMFAVEHKFGADFWYRLFIIYPNGQVAEANEWVALPEGGLLQSYSLTAKFDLFLSVKDVFPKDPEKKLTYRFDQITDLLPTLNLRDRAMRSGDFSAFTEEASAPDMRIPPAEAEVEPARGESSSKIFRVRLSDGKMVSADEAERETIVELPKDQLRNLSLNALEKPPYFKKHFPGVWMKVLSISASSQTLLSEGSIIPDEYVTERIQFSDGPGHLGKIIPDDRLPEVLPKSCLGFLAKLRAQHKT